MVGLGASAQAAVIQNGSFDGRSLSGWSLDGNGSLFGRNVEYWGVGSVPAGEAARIYSFNTFSFNSGDFASLYQDVDLTGIDSIGFDAELKGCCGNYVGFEASFSIGGTSYWSAKSSGVYSSISIDVSGLSGIHRISFANEAIFTGTFSSHWFLFDDVVAIGDGVSPVPLPASGLLLFGALGGFGFLRRKRKPS